MEFTEKDFQDIVASALYNYTISMYDFIDYCIDEYNTNNSDKKIDKQLLANIVTSKQKYSPKPIEYFDDADKEFFRIAANVLLSQISNGIISDSTEKIYNDIGVKMAISQEMAKAIAEEKMALYLKSVAEVIISSIIKI